MTRPRRPARKPASAPLPAVLDSWHIALEAANKRPQTIYLYTRTATLFIQYLAGLDEPVADVESVTRDHVRRFLIHERERTSASSARTHFNNLRVWWRWLVDEEERTPPSPVNKEDAPQTTAKTKEYFTVEQQRALLAACKGNSFAARRDAALLRVLIDAGVRVEGLSEILLKNVDLRSRVIKIVLKGGDEFLAPIGSKTAQALDRYIRIRATHWCSASPYLWLSLGGTRQTGLTPVGIRRILRERARQAGIEVKVNPHKFRGTAAHQLLAAGMNTDEVQRVLGWRSMEMVMHYAGDLAVARARKSHAQMSPSDRI